MKSIIIYIIMISSLFLSCSRYPKDVREALKQAGNNREELEKVIDYYSHKQADSLKLKAAYFLIGNLTEQYYFKGNSLDIYNKEILKMEDKSVARLMNVWDSIYRIYGNDFEINKDIEFVNSEMLIENIEMSFKVWKKEWNQSISFDEFCEFILPYKSSNEKPQVGWRTELYDKYKWITDSIYNKEDLLNLCISTNKEFKKLFKLSLSYQYPVDLSFNMASIIQTGSCDMGAKTVLYPMRALGIPVSYDYAPFWANRSQKHNWNALIIDGKHKTFNGGDNDVGSHKVEFIGVGRMKYKPAKVFRKTYAIQKNSLPFLIKRGEDIPDMFKNKRIKDVTNEYLPVSDIHLNFDKKLTSNIRIGYLCTFNNVDWQIYYWGLKNKNELIFKNMGRDVAYLPVIYREGNIIPIGDPLILTSEGKIKICKANLNQKQKIIAFSKYPEDQSNNIFPDHEYELFYWKNVWVSLGKQVAHTNYLIYENAPTNALFWIRDHSGGKQERIFTYEHNEQIWW